MSRPESSAADPDPKSLEELLDRLRASGREHDPIDIGTIVEAAGRRSFAPLLLVAGLIALSPVSGVPGVPTTVAALVMLVAVQMLVGRRHFWLPRWLTRRRLPHATFCRALGFMRRPARRIDRLLGPRLTVLTHNVGVYAVALVCLLIAGTMPPLELMPFAASIAGAALALFGLALMVNDGVLGLIAWLFTAAAAYVAIQSLG